MQMEAKNTSSFHLYTLMASAIQQGSTTNNALRNTPGSRSDTGGNCRHNDACCEINLKLVDFASWRHLSDVSTPQK